MALARNPLQPGTLGKLRVEVDAFGDAYPELRTVAVGKSDLADALRRCVQGETDRDRERHLDDWRADMEMRLNPSRGCRR